MKEEEMEQESEIKSDDVLAMDTKVSWFVCMCSSLANVIIIGSLYSYGIIFPKILEEFQEGKAKTAMVASISMGLYTFSCPVAAKLSVRYGCRAVMVASGPTCALGFLGSSFAPNLYVLYFSYGILIGFGSAMVYMAAWGIIPLYFDKSRHVATGTLSLGIGAGVLVMTAVTQAILEQFDWRKTLLVLAAINLLPSILGCSIARKKISTAVEEGMSSRLRENSDNGCCRCLRVLDVSIFRDPFFMIISIAVAIAVAGNMIPYVHLAKYAAENGIPSHLSSWMYFTIGTCSLLSRLLTGKLCDTGWIPHLRINQLAVVIYAVGDFMVPLATTFTSLMMYSVLVGVCDGLFATSALCIFVSSFSGTGLGWAFFFQGFSLFLSPVLAGFIADVSGSYHPAFYTAGGILLLSAAVSQLTRCIKTKTENGSNRMEFEREELVLIVTERETVC